MILVYFWLPKIWDKTKFHVWMGVYVWCIERVDESSLGNIHRFHLHHLLYFTFHLLSLINQNPSDCIIDHEINVPSLNNRDQTCAKLFEARIKTQFVNINAYAIVVNRRIDHWERTHPNCGFLSGISLIGILLLGPTVSTKLLRSSYSWNLQIILILEQNKYCYFHVFKTSTQSYLLTYLSVCSLFSIGPWRIPSKYFIAICCDIVSLLKTLIPIDLQVRFF